MALAYLHVELVQVKCNHCIAHHIFPSLLLPAMTKAKQPYNTETLDELHGAGLHSRSGWQCNTCSPVREGPVDEQDGAVIDQGDGFCVLVDGSIVPASKQSSAKLLEGAGSAATGMAHACSLAALE